MLATNVAARLFLPLHSFIAYIQMIVESSFRVALRIHSKITIQFE